MKKRNVLASLAASAVALVLVGCSGSANGQSGRVGPGPGGFEDGHIIGQLAKWDRKATPMLTLRVHGAGMLQTFAPISSDGSFKLPLPEVPVKGNFGTMNCGGQGKGNIVVAYDVSLLTKLPGFNTPGRWDREHSVIGGALFSDEYYSKNIGKEGGKRAQWLHSHVERMVEAGECNNANAFPLEEGWNAFTVVTGPSGGPHTYNVGLDSDLGWYWYGFPEDISKANTSKPVAETDSKPSMGGSKVSAEWLAGEWDGTQVDVTMKLRLQPSGNVWLESIEGGSKKTMEGTWSLSYDAFVLEIPEGRLPFNIEQISRTSFRLFGPTSGGSDIVFTRKN